MKGKKADLKKKGREEKSRRRRNDGEKGDIR